MNRKQFLKSLVALPVIGLFFGKNIFAKNIEQPNPYKLPFIDSKNNQIKEDDIFVQTIYHYEIRDEIKLNFLTNNDIFSLIYHPKKINYKRSFNVDNSEYFITYFDGKKHYLNEYQAIIFGEKLDWWIPIKYINNKNRTVQYIVDEDLVNDKSTYLTIKDKEIIRRFLNKRNRMLKREKNNG